MASVKANAWCSSARCSPQLQEVMVHSGIEERSVTVTSRSLWQNKNHPTRTPTRTALMYSRKGDLQNLANTNPPSSQNLRSAFVYLSGPFLARCGYWYGKTSTHLWCVCARHVGKAQPSPAKSNDESWGEYSKRKKEPVRQTLFQQCAAGAP